MANLAGLVESEMGAATLRSRRWRARYCDARGFDLSAHINGVVLEFSRRGYAEFFNTVMVSQKDGREPCDSATRHTPDSFPSYLTACSTRGAVAAEHFLIATDTSGFRIGSR